MIGTGISAMMVSRTFMPSMNMTAITSRIIMRSIEVICSEMKFFIVSMSEVQRWMMSPVRFFMCHAKGRCSMCSKSPSRMVLTMVSAAMEFVRRKRY